MAAFPRHTFVAVKEKSSGLPMGNSYKLTGRTIEFHLISIALLTRSIQPEFDHSLSTPACEFRFPLLAAN
jgi:hypothetical protein